MSQLNSHQLIELLNKKGKAYLAGGWFSDEQMDRLLYVRDSLKVIGFDVYSPKDEALCSQDASQDFREEVFKGNVSAIKEASFMFAITNCKDPGTLFECGVAYSNRIPIVYFAEGLDGPFNLMLAQSGNHVITSRTQLLKDMESVEVLESLLTNNKIKYSGGIE